MTTTTNTSEKVLDAERQDLIEALDKHRYFLRHTLRDLSDEEAAEQTTASELCLGGLIKHVAATEAQWVEFVLRGPQAMASTAGDWNSGEPDVSAWLSQFKMLPGETLAELLEHYDEVARRTDELVATLPDLNVGHELPAAPWFPKNTRWSARRVFLHIIAETAQHAGHADIIRESLDGAKSMG